MDDLIDFPVSSDWLDFYHERGLTPRSSGKLSRTERMLLERIEKLEEQMARQLEILLAIAEKLQERSVGKNTENVIEQEWERLKE